MRNFRIPFLLLTIIAVVAVSSAVARIKNGEELISAMHRKYAGKWYKTLTFVQKNSAYKPDGTVESSKWYEAMDTSGKLRIDFDPLDKGDGAIYADNLQYDFKDGKLVNSRSTINPLLVLGFAVYAQPVEKTFEQLREFKFDWSVLHEDTWQGKAIYVVGANRGDTKSPQFWVEKNNLLFVRMIQPIGKNKDHLQEFQFNKYQKVLDGWISPEVVMSIDGNRTWMEEYSDIQTNIPLDKNLFDAQRWMSADRKYFVKK